MRKITKKQYERISNDYKGTYSDYDGTHPHLKGRKTMLANEDGATVLIIEGVHFEIVDEIVE